MMEMVPEKDSGILEKDSDNGFWTLEGRGLVSATTCVRRVA